LSRRVQVLVQCSGTLGDDALARCIADAAGGAELSG
jgi:hypothetical protein